MVVVPPLTALFGKWVLTRYGWKLRVRTGCWKRLGIVEVALHAHPEPHAGANATYSEERYPSVPCWVEELPFLGLSGGPPGLSIGERDETPPGNPSPPPSQIHSEEEEEEKEGLAGHRAAPSPAMGAAEPKAALRVYNTLSMCYLSRPDLPWEVFYCI